MALKGCNGRICYVATTFVLKNDFRFAQKQCPGLVERGFEVSYFVQSDTGEDFKGVKIFPVNRERNKLREGLVPWRILPRLLRHPCDAYHLCNVVMLPIALVLKLITRRRIVFDFREDYIEFVRLSPYLKEPLKTLLVGVTSALVWMVCKISDGIVFGDEPVQKSCPPIPAGRQVFVHHFPLLSMFSASPLSFARRPYDVVYAGTISELKGAFGMLEVIKLLKERCGKIRALFIGEPVRYIKENFYKYIKENKLDTCLEITGKVPYEKVPGLLDQCKVGLIGLHDLLKYHKQSSAKLFEYMAKGIPCVSVDLPPERMYMESGKHGYLVPPQNPRAMADAVYKLISTPQLGQEMAENAREHLLKQGYFGENEMDSLAEFYGYVLAHPRRGLFRND